MRKDERFGFVTIPDAEYADVRVDWPLVGTHGVIVEETVQELAEVLCEVQSMQADWLPENLVPGGVFIEAAAQQMWDIDHDCPIAPIVSTDYFGQR